MIRIHHGELLDLSVAAFIRTVGTDLEPCTARDGSLGERAGSGVLDRLRAFGEVPIGGVLVTPGGGLPVPYLLHLVVRSQDEPISESGVSRALRNALHQAAEWQMERVGLHLPGVGPGCLDTEVAARLLFEVARGHMAVRDFPAEVTIAVLSPYEEDVMRRELDRGAGEASKVTDLPWLDAESS